MRSAAAIRRAQPDVWRLAVHLVGRDDADDVTQDVFLRAYRSLPGFRAESSGRTWLLTITRCACADVVRRLAAPAPTPGPARTRTTTVRRPGRATARSVSTSSWPGSTRDRRAAFVLTQMLGCSYAEAAEICDTAVGTIRSRVARARADLLEQMRAADTA